MPNSTEPPVLDLKASLKKPLQWALAAGLFTAVVTLFMQNYFRSEARLLPVEAKGAGGFGQSGRCRRCLWCQCARR